MKLNNTVKLNANKNKKTLKKKLKHSLFGILKMERKKGWTLKNKEEYIN